MKRLLVIVALAVLTATSVFGGTGTRSAEANDIAPFQTVFATDVSSAGYGGMRTIGTGTITLSGVSGTVSKALLFWHGPTNSSDPAANATVSFGGTVVTGTNIGLSSDNCWKFLNSQAYRADVTSLVSGNGTYALANFTKPSVDINGASLIVFFDDGNTANNRDVVMFDGNDSNTSNSFDANGWNVSLPGVNYTLGAASMDLHVSDGQAFDDDALVLNGTTTLAPVGPVFQGDTVPNGASATTTEGGLWDIKSYNITSALTPGPNTLTLTTGQESDCLSLIVAMVNLPAGAAPGQPTATPTSTATSTATNTPPPAATSTPQPSATAAATGIQPPNTGSGDAAGASRGLGLMVTILTALAIPAGAAATGFGLRLGRR